MVCLVDIHGDRGDVRLEPCAADGWPLWTDLVRVHVGRRDHDEHAFGVLAGDIVGTILARVDAAADGLDCESGCEPLPDPAKLADWREIEDWPDAPDADPHCRFPGAPTLAERRGEAPFEPSPADWEHYRLHYDRLEKLYGYE
jgi:hypothetical protein